MNEQSFKSLFHSGVKFLKKGMQEQALNRFFKVLELAPSCSEAYNNVGIIYFNSRNYSSPENKFGFYYTNLEDC